VTTLQLLAHGLFFLVDTARAQRRMAAASKATEGVTMISGIGSSTSYCSSPFATNGTSNSNSSSSLAQTEQQLFCAIDANGDGGLSQGELTNFLDKTAAATGGSSNQTQAAAALFSRMSNGSGSISLQQFQSNAGDLVTQLQSERAAGSAASSGSSSSSATSSLLSQMVQSAQSLAAGSAAAIANSTSSSATSNTNNSSSTGQHHHHGHGGGGSSLISQFMQQYQAAGATSATSSILSASA
ncbi:MAG: hypothetical protein ACRETD_01685, partial [Steroidobacteraceae bacterium]